MGSLRVSVAKHRGSWTVRAHLVDPITGKRRELRRKARSRAEACDLRDTLARELREIGNTFPSAEKKTFADLADYYDAQYAQPAQYVDGRKVLGMRAYKDARGYARILRLYFGGRLLRTITYGDLLLLKQKLVETPTWQRRSRSVANVNRILSTLRRMLNIASRESWISKNPFSSGDSLISVADEHKRQRILSREEEARLLNALAHPRRAHARPLVICALDTAMRFGEIPLRDVFEIWIRSDPAVYRRVNHLQDRLPEYRTAANALRFSASQLRRVSDIQREFAEFYGESPVRGGADCDKLAEDLLRVAEDLEEEVARCGRRQLVPNYMKRIWVAEFAELAKEKTGNYYDDIGLLLSQIRAEAEDLPGLAVSRCPQ